MAKLDKFYEYDVKKASSIEDKRSNLLSKAYGYENEVLDSLELLNGQMNLDSDAFKKFAPSKKHRPSWFYMDALLNSMHDIRALDNNLTYDPIENVYYNGQCQVDKGACAQILYDPENLINFFNVMIKDQIKEILGREYELVFDKHNGPIIIVKDETLKEYLDRQYGEDNYALFLVPLIGQLLFIPFIWHFIFALFTKKWKHDK